ncbi:hypothetical protein FB451DRAFT_1203606 [Mycena latifolia]|nr:hypothetical protein FB451DRAFT_1203606 [Mycena latifolia]
MEVIDLTVDSPTRKDDRDPDEARQTRRERRRERRAKEEKQEEAGPKKTGIGNGSATTRRRRESSAERDPDRRRNRRKKDRDRDPDPPIPDEQLFFKPNELVLPAHVSVFGETPINIPAAALDSDEDEYIEYLDYDNRKCKKCGAEDEHITAECHVLICLTCGVRDEHSTRSCNIGKTCYTCGMKGHINIVCSVETSCIVANVHQDCPNRYASRTWTYDGCERCNSSSHQTSECPGLWRLYVYVEDIEQERILRTRKDKKDLPLGQGGEGYIADDEWCYNCGGAGHWGDDCREFYHPEPLVEPTAFSYHVLSKGPFAPPKLASGSRAPRDWEREVALPSGLENVGQRAKKKEMEKLARRAQQQQEADEPESWFQKPRNSERERERPADSLPTGPRKMKISSSVQEAARPFQFTAAPSSSKLSLSDRLSDPTPNGHHSAKAHSNSRRERDRSDRHRSDRERDKSRHRDERGPRYKGGYSR